MVPPSGDFRFCPQSRHAIEGSLSGWSMLLLCLLGATCVQATNESVAFKFVDK